MPTAESASRMRPSSSPCGTPKFSKAKSSSSSTREETICASMSWNTEPTMRLRSVGVCSTVSRPPTRQAP